MTSPSSATVPFTTSFRFPPHIVLLIFAALIYGASALQQPTMTFCSGQSPYFASSPAITSGELASFLDAVCAGAYGAAHRSHSMSASVAGTNRTMYGVAECLPDVPVPDCAACLAAASARLITWRTSCAASAVWHDACFLRFSDGDPVLFHEDEYTATVFNASRGGPSLLPHEDGGKAVVRRLLVAAGNSTVSSHTCRGVGASSAADDGHVYGLTRCAAGMSCADCRRCLRGALAAVEREYNGSAGMQVLRLSCMARYESYPFYKATPRQLAANIHFTLNRTSNGTITVNTPDAKFPPPPPPTVLDPFAISPPPPVAQSAPTNPTGAGPTAQPQDTPPPGKTSAMQQSHDGKTPKMLMLTVPITTGLVVVSVILGLIIWYRRKQPLPAHRGHAIDGTRGENMHGQGEEQWSTEEEDEDGRRTSCCQLYSYQVLEAATGHFSKSNKLGSGGFGTVFRGTLENGKQVAVKRLRDSKRSIHQLDREISIVSDLRHKNLVRFLGYCFQEEGKFLIYECVPNNSLEKFWHKARHQSQKLEWATWFNIIKGVARGLQFLHNKGILHRDLKPHNVLLDENFNPKIADFDLMRIYDKQKTHESTEKVAGTFGYMAPECTSGRKFLLSVKSDVYSYGVLVLEIITGHKIYTFEGQNSEGLVEYVWHHWTEKRVGDIIDGDLGIDDGQEEHAARQALRCVHVALLCVQSDRSRRPTMGQVIAMLISEDMMEDLQEPSLPGYVVFRPTAASGPVRLSCLGCR